MKTNTRSSFRPRFESLETRTLMATLTGPLVAPPAAVAPAIAGAATAGAKTAAPPVGPVWMQLATTATTKSIAAAAPQLAAAAPSIGDKMAAFLNAQLGKRLGGGECAHLATEALRANGAEFRGFVDNAGGDYVWGTLVTKIEFTGGKVVDSNPASAVKVGDVIQYKGASFTTGGKADHHTSVVAAVDAQGRPTAVYEQNVGRLGKTGNDQVRFVVKQAIDFKKLNAGSVRIYRPVAVTTPANTFEFTLVNNTTSNRVVTGQVGTSTIGNYSLTAANTAGSYMNAYIMATGATPKLTIAGKSINIVNGAGYELYNDATGAVNIRKLAQ